MSQANVQPDQATLSPEEAPAHAASSITYLFTGGGTGGHIYPALAIADEIRARNSKARIVYIGARGKVEATLVPKSGYPIHLVHACGLPSSRNPFALFNFFIQTCIGVLQCLVHLLRIRPQMIVATGGFASSPALLALAVLKFLHVSSARCFVHEQNVVPGKVNKLAGRIADQIGVSFKESLRYFPANKASFVGYPIRHEIGAGSRYEARAALGIPDQANVIFAFGASSGARSINRAIVDALPILLAKSNVHVIHLTGQTKNEDYDAIEDTNGRIEHLDLSPEDLSRYHQSAYSHEIQQLYAASDIVIGRASAGTVTEIGVCGRPAILIPLPYAPGDHQAMNARTLETVGAAYVIYESVILENGQTVGTVDSQRLVQRIYDILDNPDQQAIMEERARETFDQHGLKRIVDLLNDLMNPASDSIQSYNGTAREEKISDNHEADTSLSPFGLVKRFRHGRDETFIRSLGEDYLKYRVDGFLKSPRWPIRNEGVKLVGLLNYQDRVSFMLSLLQDKTPVSWMQRLFGGDYKQVGFIRRNAVTTIQQLGLYNKEIRKTLLDLLDDPYYEVRTVATRAFAVLIPQDADTDTEIVTRILDLIQDRSFEVKAEAVLTLGKIGTASVIDDFRPLYLFPNWKVRTAVISALTDLVRRHLISDLEALQRDLDNILVTCVHFEPTFPIKQTLNNLTEVIRQHHSA